MNDNILNNNDDNLYKYLVIIGLSLLVLYPLSNTGRLDLSLHTIDVQNELTKSIQKNNEQQKKLLILESNYKNEYEAHMEKITKEISEMNLHDAKGKNIETIDDLIFQMELFISTVDNLNDNINSDNYEEFESAVNPILSMFGISNNYNDFIQVIDNLNQKIIYISGIVKDWNEYSSYNNSELEQIDVELQEVAETANDLEVKAKKILTQREYYESEVIWIVFLRYLGITMIFLGSFLWYMKIQRYRDIKYAKGKSMQGFWSKVKKRYSRSPKCPINQ